MKNVLIIGAALCGIFAASLTAAADTGSAVIQACQSLKRQSDRNKCLEEAVRQLSEKSSAQIKSEPTPPPTPSKKEISAKRAESVFASINAIQSIIDLGISYNDYQPYIQRLAIDLGHYKATVEFDEEKAAVSAFDNALQAYRDAASYWYADIEFYARSNNRIAYADSLPSALAGVDGIIYRYSIPTQKSDIWGIYQGAPRSVALSTIWGYARDQISEAKKAISFEEKPHQVAPAEAVVAAPSKPRRSRIGNEPPEAIAMDMLTSSQKVDHVESVSDVFVIANAFICGTVNVKTNSEAPQSKRFVLTPSFDSVYIDDQGESFQLMWKSYCTRASI